MTAGSVLEELATRPDRFPGALLLASDSEERLMDESRRLAARLLCPGGDPRGACDACRRTLAGLHPDLFVVELEPERLQIRVDQVRDALAFGAGRPYESTRRVAVVSRADLLGEEGGNALLKSLEEPGRSFHWILTTTRPELLLPTIRSRCALANLPPLSRAQREAAWRETGFSDEDAADLTRAAIPPGPEARESLADYRRTRTRIAEALREGLSRRKIDVLVLLADELGDEDHREPSRLATELLADAVLGPEPPAGALRHASVAGTLREVARAVPPESLRRAVLRALDAPPDRRRGKLRLHWEAVLIDLWESARPAEA